MSETKDKPDQEQIRLNYKKERLEENEDFHRYLDGVFPKPRGLLLEKFKRKYYKRHFQKDFEINFDNINAKVTFSIILSITPHFPAYYHILPIQQPGPNPLKTGLLPTKTRLHDQRIHPSQNLSHLHQQKRGRRPSQNIQSRAQRLPQRPRSHLRIRRDHRPQLFRRQANCQSPLSQNGNHDRDC